MSITVNEALKLEKFQDFKVAAGKAGLKNKIKKVGILDYETKEMIEGNFTEGEFVISTLLVIKDKIEQLYEIVEKLISVGVSGLAIKNIYFKSIPKEVIKLADKKSFPIMMFSDVYFEDVITCIVDAVNDKQDSKALELKIDNILYSNLSKVIIKNIAYEINRDFRDKNIAVYCKRKKGKQTVDLITENEKIHNGLGKIIPYKGGYLIIRTFDSIDTEASKQIILKDLEILGITSKQYTIGIGNLHEKLGDLDFSIKESLYAFKYSMIYKANISFFNAIGTNKILIPLINDPWIQKYYDEMITPMLYYDRKNDTELLKTAKIYVENNGNIKAAAKELSQHSNTIRYRIDKIYKILGTCCNSEHCYEELALAIRVHNLMDAYL